MEIKETLALVPTVVGSLKTIKETCDGLNAGFLPQNRQKLKNLQQQIKELEEIIQLGFPQLASLTKSYAEVSANVRVAQVLSDKNYELLGLTQDPKFVYALLIRIPGEMERDCTKVEKGIINLPETNTTELGRARGIITIIRRDLDRFKQFTRTDSSELEVSKSLDSKSKDEARRLTSDIAAQYSDLDSILSSLLNRILENISQAKV